MRTMYHRQLSALCLRVGDMCGLAATAMENATRALLDADVSLAEQVITDHDRIVQLRRRTEDAALKLLALQQPVAGELRTILASVHIGADIERMGALAVHVADLTRLRHPECCVPAELRGYFTEMGSVAVQLARTAQDVVASGDPDRAARLREQDDVVDAQHRHLFTLLMDRNWHSGVCSAVDVALLSRYYERFADHAVEIGRRVVFEATGGMPATKQMA